MHLFISSLMKWYHLDMFKHVVNINSLLTLHSNSYNEKYSIIVSCQLRYEVLKLNTLFFSFFYNMLSNVCHD